MTYYQIVLIKLMIIILEINKII